MTVKIAINGFGRIGRNALRALIQNPRVELEIVAINQPSQTTAEAAHALQYDSVLGRLDARVLALKDALVVDGRRIAYSRQHLPEQCPWQALGVDIVLECSGKFNDIESARRHLAAGASKVIVSAPSDEDGATIVVGVNEADYNPDTDDVISNASCTTNCLAPVLKVLDRAFGIRSGFITTVHSFTLDQRLLDGSHKDPRRSRAATQSIIPTSTGAARSIGRVLPNMKGKLSGGALRVPVPNVSLIDLVINTREEVMVESINEALRSAAHGDLEGILAVSDEPLVSCDFRGDPHSAIVDSSLTMVQDRHSAKVMVWYDNEWGYALRLLDLAGIVARSLLVGRGTSGTADRSSAHPITTGEHAPLHRPGGDDSAEWSSADPEHALEHWLMVGRKDRDFC